MGKQTTNIDDLGYIYFSVGIESAPFMNRDIDNKFAGGIFLGIIDFFLRFFYYLLKSPLRYSLSMKKENRILVYGESTNNIYTLHPIIERLDKDKVIDLNSHKQYPKWKQYWYAIPHLFEFLRDLRRHDQEGQEIIKYFFAKYWAMYGCHRAAEKLLDYYHPKVLVMANDHLPFHRALMHEANARGIVTIYVQHAAVTEKFPPLGFTYSLLDGEDSYKKYKLKERTSGNIYLSGGIRFDAIKEIEIQDKDEIVVGVAINQIDDETIVKDTCLQIAKANIGEQSIDVILRPHPQMQIEMWHEWCEQNGIGFSVAKNETSFQFISRITVLVSNQSSIHLDAAMCHTPSVVYKLSNVELDDSYSFVRNGLAQKVEDVEELIRFIEHREKYQANAEAIKYYNCSYGAIYEGNVASMMADLIDSIPYRIDKFNSKYGFEIMEEDGLKKVFKTK